MAGPHPRRQFVAWLHLPTYSQIRSHLFGWDFLSHFLSPVVSIDEFLRYTPDTLNPLKQQARLSMPRLRRYVDGKGFYIKSYPVGGNPSTSQINDVGVDYLRKLGISNDGDSISARVLRYLHDKGW